MSKLKPCPQCGSDDITQTTNRWGNHVVLCTRCGHIKKGFTEAEAVAEWNDRGGEANA